MNPILRIIIILTNFILAYFLAGEVINDITINQYIILTIIIVFTAIFSIFTTSIVRIERRLEVEDNQQKDFDEQ